MFFLLLKKSFFDAWDNLGALIIGNISFFLLMVMGLWPMMKLLEKENLSGLLILIILIPLAFAALGLISAVMSRIADFQRFSWSEIPEALRQTWKASILISLFTTVFFTLSVFGMIYYSHMKSMLGLAASALLFWITVGVYFVLIWFFPVRNRLSGDFRKSLRKSSLIMLDNLLLTVFLGLFMIPFNLILWPFTAFGAFGPAGIQLYMNAALRLLIYKYDWLEENPQAGRKDIPWYELLVDEKERVGKRSLKGMIFPWKE
jgi:MFS family permease